MSDTIRVGDTCQRCSGTGQVYGEVFENELSVCPFMRQLSVGHWLVCDMGTITEVSDDE